MPFPLEERFVVKVEEAMDASLPSAYRAMMMAENGGRIALGRNQWWLHPIFDTSDKKRVKRSCNHVLHETRVRSESGCFPKEGLEIAADGSGNALVLLKQGDAFRDHIFEFDHETASVRQTKWTASDLSEKRESH